jgi:glycolate oxidase FAD binding subunit
MEQSETITIDGVGPMPVVRPATAAEVADVVRRCAADGTAVYPVGGGTMLDYGLPPARPGVAVELRALDRVIDFPARDMTITVEAGITVARLAEITRAEGLHLPIDVPDPDRATLGGAIACNVSGPRRYGYGTFRDYVLGITTINDRGELVSAGGRVVKNVAGYDLMKLHTGALGTLGVITQVTLRLRPVAEYEGRIEFTCYDTDSMVQALEVLHSSETKPAMIWAEIGRGDHIAKRWWTVRIRYETNKDAVEWQLEQIQKELTAAGVKYSGVEFARSPDAGVRPGQRSSDLKFVFGTGLRPSGLASISHWGWNNEAVLSIWGSGYVWGSYHITDPGRWNESIVTESQAKTILSELTDMAAEYDGNVIIKRCPPEWKKSLPVWGRPPADLALQKAVKRALDPNNIFNPGRFVTDAF